MPLSSPPEFRSTQVPFHLPRLRTVIGIDYSGAAQSGKNAWLAELKVISPADREIRPTAEQTRRTRKPRPNGDAPTGDSGPSLELVRVSRLGRLAGSDQRSAVNDYLVDRIRTARQTLFGMDFPFGLPIELALGDWIDQLEHVASFSGGAKRFGHHLVARSVDQTGKTHLRRSTDRESSTPFHGFHYRIIYQTFHGMREVLAPIADDSCTAVWPFQYERSQPARVVVEACPSSTLKRWGLPHQNYKQSGGKPPSPKHVGNRQAILRVLTRLVTVSAYQRRVMMKNPGGDAIDAVLAAAGSWQDYHHVDHQAVANHSRYCREGRVYG